MNRYIDADETLEQIRKKLGVKSLDYLLEAERQIVAVIQSMPSIDIVRCEECKSRGFYFEDADMYICNACDQLAFDPMHFCSYGEREDE